MSARDRALPAAVDPVLVDRWIAGEHDLPTNRAERVEITLRWVESGRGTGVLARVANWNVWEVLRNHQEAS